MGKKYVLAVDQSTQGTKAMLFDEKGTAVHRSDLPHKQYINEKGWVSHDLHEIYRNTLQAVRNLIKESGVAKEEIVCLGISNQRETSAAWDRITGEPLAPAVVWQCARADEICGRVKETGVSEPIREKTGLRLSPYFPAAKYAWLLENVEAVRAAEEERRLCFGTIDSWLVFKLTEGKVFATDYSNASRTQLYNIKNLNWDSEICQWFSIDRETLPEVRDSDGFYGTTDFEGLFSEPLAICGVIGDSQGALFGQGCVERGMVKATYGTGSSVMINMGNDFLLSGSGLVTSLAWGLDGKVSYVLEGNINYTGAVITWLVKDMGLIQSPGESEALAGEANKADTTYLVPAFSGLSAPYWKTDAKAILCGMTRTTGKREVVKAALESIAYQISDVVNMMKAENGCQAKELCVDGGPTRNSYLMKFQSDILGIPVILPGCEESSARGAAFLAGLRQGIYKKEEVFRTGDRTAFYPVMAEEERNKKYEGWKQAVEKVR